MFTFVCIHNEYYRLDVDQCIRRNVQDHLEVDDPDYYEFEAHIFFDDAMEAHADDEYDYQVNSFVKLLVDTVDKGARLVLDGPNKC